MLVIFRISLLEYGAVGQFFFGVYFSTWLQKSSRFKSAIPRCLIHHLVLEYEICTEELRGILTVDPPPPLEAGVWTSL